MAKSPKGVYDISYLKGRQTKRSFKYRLRRRTDEVRRAIIQNGKYSSGIILDIGTADTLMLLRLSEILHGDFTYIGLDYSYELLSSLPASIIHRLQGDALELPFHGESVSMVIATAVIEHVRDASQFVKSVYEILMPGGLFIVTTPNPVIAHISEKIGLLKDPDHYQEYHLSDLEDMLKRQSFSILDSYKFMFSPVGFPAEQIFEKMIRGLGLSFIMANQFVVAKKDG